MAGGSLGSLTIDLAANITRFEQSLNRAEHLAETRSKAIQRSVTRLATGIGASLASYGFVQAVESALDFADAIGKAADRAGVGTQRLQELRYAADQFGISTNQLDDGLRRFTRRLGVALDGGSFEKDFLNLGVAIRDVNGNVRSSEAVFDDVVVAMGKLGSAAEKSKVAAQLFGDDAGPQLALLLGKGKGAIDSLAAEAQSLGIILSDDVVRGAEAANDEISKVTQIIKINATSAFAELAPHIQEFAQALTDLTKGDIQNLPEWMKTVALSVEVVDFAFEEATAMIGKFGAAAVLLAGGEFAALKELFESSAESTRSNTQALDDYVAKLYEMPSARAASGGADSAGTGDAEVKNFLTGLTEGEMEYQLAQAIKMEEELNQSTIDAQKELTAHQIREGKKRQDAEIATAKYIDNARESSIQNGIALLRVFGRESKSAALAALAIEKALAIATAIAGTQAAMAKSRIIDPTGALAAKIAVEGALNVATIAALGLAQASQINTSGGSSPTGSIQDPFAVDTDPFGTVSEPQTGTRGTITINVNGVVTPEIMQDLIIPAIQDATNDKDVILFNNDSRQAQELVY